MVRTMSRVTSKLQVTIPKAIAERHGIRPGVEVDWQSAGDVIRVVVEPPEAPPDDVERVAPRHLMQPHRHRAFDVAIGPDGTVHVAHVEETALFISSRTPPTPESPWGIWSKEYVAWGVTDVSDLRIGPDGSLIIALTRDHDESGVGSTSSVWFARRAAPMP